VVIAAIASRKLPSLLLQRQSRRKYFLPCGYSGNRVVELPLRKLEWQISCKLKIFWF